MWYAILAVVLLVIMLIVRYVKNEGSIYQVLDEAGRSVKTGSYGECWDYKIAQEKYCRSFGISGKTYRVVKSNF